MENNYGRNCSLDRFEYMVNFDARRYERKRSTENITEEGTSFLEEMVERDSGFSSFLDSGVVKEICFEKHSKNI
ncbi:MAG TPA: hypothetical protein VJB94_02405 [Candidatus Nanoarchaeia archaeon]|nr:hypothetical protein [Candidatus Nanoarchaeia archaeon]